jgi:hypothetical protein
MQAVIDKPTSSPAEAWRLIKIDNLKRLRAAIMMKYGTISNAAESMGVKYNGLSNTINGRYTFVPQISALQKDLSLTDAQVLHLWPLLGHWPKEER